MDYAALAKQYGGETQPAPATVDYAALAKQYGGTSQAAQSPATQNTQGWGDTALSAVKNTPKSALNLVSGIYQAVRHPIDTANNVLDLGAGALHNALPTSVTKIIDSVDANNPEAKKRLQDSISKADAVGAQYKKDYGSLEGFKNKIATDPVGVAADLSTVATGGSSFAGKIPQAARLSDVMGTVGKYTNPVNAVTAAASEGTNLAGFLGRNGLGLSTGVGAQNIAQAAKSGFKNEKDYWNNLAGNVPTTDILTQARDALQTMRNNRGAEYKSGIATTAADNTKLNFTDIDKALGDVTSSMKSGGHWKIGPSEVGKVNEVAEIVDEWRKDPGMHTAIGLDALKQRLDAVYPESPIHNQAQRAISQVRNAVKDTIVKQSPEYAKTMDAYEEAIGLEQEIQKALSLGRNASADTAMRKLQSLTRNNVNTNYGSRLELAKALQDLGGTDLMPGIAGQAMNSWTSRGLAGQAGSMATLGSAFSHPAVLGLLPLQSPRAVGAALYGAGRGVGIASDMAKNAGAQLPMNLKSLMTMTPEQAKQAALLLYQSNKASGQQSP